MVCAVISCYSSAVVLNARAHKPIRGARQHGFAGQAAILPYEMETPRQAFCCFFFFGMGTQAAKREPARDLRPQRCIWATAPDKLKAKGASVSLAGTCSWFRIPNQKCRRRPQ